MQQEMTQKIGPKKAKISCWFTVNSSIVTDLWATGYKPYAIFLNKFYLNILLIQLKEYFLVTQ